MFVLSSSLRTPDLYLLESSRPPSSSPPPPAPQGPRTSYQTTQELTLTSMCCIQYVSKSGKPSSGYSTGKGQSTSQFPRRVALRNVLTIGQLTSSPMLVRTCLKSCMLVFQFSRSVVSDSLEPHELQHTRPPCPLQFPEFTQNHVH